MHAQHRFSETTLVQRYEKEARTLMTGDSRNFDFNMLDLMELLYGKKRAKIYKKRWGLDKPRP